MPTILEALRAVRSSNLPPLARHIVTTLIGLADPDTCSIPDRYQPSLSELAKFTGLSRSTVAVQLTALEGAGWLKRDKPDVHRSWRDKERTRYFVLVPTSPGDGLVRETDTSGTRTSPADGTDVRFGLVREPDWTSPGAGHALRTTTGLETNSPSDAMAAQAGPAEEAPGRPAKPKRPTRPEPYREDVESLCVLLADLIEQNGSPRPNITDAWRKAARLLLDDKRRKPRLTVEKVAALIRWCQNDEFWKSNIESMPTFRKQYDKLRMRANAEWERSRTQHSAHGNRQSTPSAPAAIPRDEQCPEHRGQRAATCGPCRARRLTGETP